MEQTKKTEAVQVAQTSLQDLIRAVVEKKVCDKKRFLFKTRITGFSNDDVDKQAKEIFAKRIIDMLADVKESRIDGIYIYFGKRELIDFVFEAEKWILLTPKTIGVDAILKMLVEKNAL